MEDKKRRAVYGVDPLFLHRWSPRSLSGEALDHDRLLTILEAGSWAPSAYNNQEWRFVYAHRETAAWPRLFDCLVDANKIWACRAAVLILLISSKVFEMNGKPSPTHSLSAGAAWMALALQTSMLEGGWAAHGMSGFDEKKARSGCCVPDGYAIEMMIAIGEIASPDLLPDDLRRVEFPSQRKPLKSVIFEGVFNDPEDQ